MKRVVLLLLFFSSLTFYAQGIAIDTTSQTVPQLVSNILLQNSCFNETNFQFSSHRGIGQFTNTNPNFPIQEGIVIRNGIAKYTEGQYTGLNESSFLTNAGDPDLQNISNASGQTLPIRDVAYIQFDFTPLSSSFSFDFLFASNEYGEYQCGFNDIFAFLLTDLTTGVTTNLAVIPNTNIPISIKTIRDNQYNSGCTSSNPGLFGPYNVNNPGTSAINMRGQTALLTASSTVTPNNPYRIKLAIGDYNDSNFDSAVFIAGKSFTTHTNLGSDTTICQGETIVLQSGLGPQFNHVWTFNHNIIPGATSSSLSVTQAGLYSVIATTTNGTCQMTDEIEITDLTIGTPQDIRVCNNGSTNYPFNLTQNNATVLGLNPADFDVLYYASLADANANNPIPASDINSYLSTGGQTIYIKVRKHNGNLICDNLTSFDLIVNNTITPGQALNMTKCSNRNGQLSFDLTVETPIVLNGQSLSDFSIQYFTSQSNADNNTNSIADPTAFIVNASQSPVTIWVRMTDVNNLNCYALTSFTITILPLPLVDVHPDVIECSSYVLPPITNGNYFSGSSGSGTPLFPGDTITQQGTYYIYNTAPGPLGCADQTTFVVTLIDQLSFPEIGCEQYIIRNAPAGNFYTGPGGTGTLLPVGTVLTTDQTIYFYAVVNGNVCQEKVYHIRILPLPVIDKPADVITCNSYILPSLAHGNYYSQPGGSGPQIQPGTNITTSQDIYVYAFDGECSNEHVFRVTIIDGPSFQPVTACGEYTLPAIEVGNYYTQPLGGGTPIPAGTVIHTSQTVYYYAPTTSSPNCTDFLNYQITILPKPLVDTPADRTECGQYILPPLTNGNYYTGTGGTGTQMSAGQILINTRTIYVYAVAANGCTNEHAFTVTIRPLPPIDSFTDIYTCTSFTLPPLNNGHYFTGPGGTGTQLSPGTEISTTQTLYIYNNWSDFPQCSNQTVFTVNAIGVEVGTFDDVKACDSYTLPNLTIGNYYTQPNGQGAVIPAGTVLTTSQTIYVYAISGNRINCTDEDDFLVTISTTPTLPNFNNVERCGSYTLPPLASGSYFSGSGGTGTAYQPGDSISNSQTVYVYLAASDNAACFSEKQFLVTIYPLLDLNIANGSICVDPITQNPLTTHTFTTGLSPALFTVEWYQNNQLIHTGPNYTATQVGQYTINTIKLTPESGNDCNYNPTTVTIEPSSIAVATLSVGEPFSDDSSITVNITGGYGHYEYQLDDGNPQSSNYFTNVSGGEHWVTITDTKNNCGNIRLRAFILKYPNFFTPNGDGYNDTWNIRDLRNQKDARIYIFDRYGKFLKQLRPDGPGWDGTYNGYPLPSTDYWFKVIFKDNGEEKEFKSHFSMKR